MALRATNSDGGVCGAGLPACRRLSSRRAERSSAAPCDARGRPGRAGPTNASSMERPMALRAIGTPPYGRGSSVEKNRAR